MNYKLYENKRYLESRFGEYKKNYNILKRDSTKLFKLLNSREECSYENTILNIMNSLGICPLCFESLNEGIKKYKGRNKALKEGENRYQITTCIACNKKIKRNDHTEILDYLEEIKYEFLRQYDDMIKTLENEIIILDNLIGGY